MVFWIARPKYHVTRAADVIWVPEDQFSMAESKASEGQRGQYCVAGAPASEVVKTDHSRQASACISFPKILLWEANGFDSSVDRDTSWDLRSVSPFRVVRKTSPYSVAWKPKVFKWIGFLKKYAVPTRGIIVLPAPEELSDHRKDKWDFLVFLVLQAYLCTRFVPSDQCQLATYHPFYVSIFVH